MDFSFKDETFVGGEDVEYRNFVAIRVCVLELTDAFEDARIERVGYEYMNLNRGKTPRGG